ncbi:DUF418 domain-containing protein [Nocardiopsis ansamitocini]|uniref:DUF418 domain-containing protein n=1 Tax=Nocardiopsis ansamitocini TaxID=1670832 RepID=A0A9W6P718_9ACTN|nr:DUF418 domain-containing protein [Nocardiopsis ansamitocini]GLU48360.1 hypothetical protein Nans01_27110 [Nocardiopsis ansamitocini]
MTHTSTPGPRSHAPPGPLPADRRSLTPDLARGVMLLLIALAHTHLFTEFIGGPGNTSAIADQITTAGTVMFVDLRAYPLFATLFGYGVAQIYRRRSEQGYAWPRTRDLLRRRGLWLIVFGLVHTALLFPADILAVYGLVTLLLMGVLRLRDRTLMILAAALLPLAVAFHSLVAVTTGRNMPLLPDGFVNELFFRLTLFSVLSVIMVVSTLVPFLIGVLAARHRILEQPHEHLRLLRWTASIGIPLAALGGLPLALDKAGVWTDVAPGDIMITSALHQVSGYAGGLGYAALIALVAVRLTGRPGPVTNALAALGQRSMTFYLAQSVAWAVLFSSYTLNLHQTSPAVGVGIAVAVWLTTVVLADLMRRRGVRGPAEVALRRLTYRGGPNTTGNGRE